MKKTKKTNNDNPQPIISHLDEMRSRLMVSLFVLITITLVSFYFSNIVYDFIISQHNFSLNIFGIAEPFTLRLKSAFIIALLLSLPFFIFQIWRFIKPAISYSDLLFFRISLIVTLILFYAGFFLSFIFILPYAVNFLLDFTPSTMNKTINASNYFSFMFLFCFSMGLISEIPILISILTRLGIITPTFLITKRKYAIVIIWIISALITPPDILTQSLIAIPLMFLYEISIFISKYIIKKQQ